MRKITTEILMIVLATMFMLAGLALILRFLDGRFLIGCALMAAGALFWTIIIRKAIEGEEQ